MRKPSIESLTKKGYSQKKIALTLHIRKSKVVSYQKTHKIGVRVAQPFWEDVKAIKELKGISHAEATKEVKYAKKWFERRQARLKGVPKARDEMQEKWYRIKRGEMERDWWKEAEGEELLDVAEYD